MILHCICVIVADLFFHRELATKKQVERREDEEQNLKEQEIFDILVAAGYFRARIKGLSAFDKIVGGMTWCILLCQYDVDVDLLFNENLSIGQKMYFRIYFFFLDEFNYNF